MKKRQQPEIRQTWETAHKSGPAESSRTYASRTSSAAGNRSSTVQQSRRRTTRNQKIKLAVTIVIGLLVLLLLTGFVFWRVVLSRINRGDADSATLPSEFNVPTESLVNPIPVVKGITNILLLGVDARDPDSIKERSDSMMILTVDTINNKIKLTSLQRDMLVYLPGREDPVKINAANAFGGPALAMRAVNDTLRLKIEDYIVVNMRGMEQIVDLAGGIMVDVTDSEIPYLNMNLNEENKLYPDTTQSAPLTNSGLQRLDGRQAVAYARIRKLDSDYQRMTRQRTVLQALFTKFKADNVVTKASVVSEGLSLITTSLTDAEITNMALSIFPLMASEIDQLQIPIKGYFTPGYFGTSSVNRCDYNGMIPLLQQFIFGKTYAFDEVKLVPESQITATSPAGTESSEEPAASSTLETTSPASSTITESSATSTAPTDSTESTETTPEISETTKQTGKPTDSTDLTEPTTEAATTTS